MDGELQNGSGNPAKSRKAARGLAILNRRAKVARLYLQGNESSLSIATKLGVCERTVKHDLQRIKEAWRASAIRDFDHQIELEKRKLDDLEREAREAWERSQEPTEIVTVEKDAAGKLAKTIIKEEERKGDPQHLTNALRACADRRKLLGLEQPAPKQHAHFHAHLGSTSDAGANQQRDQLLALARKFGIAGEVFEGTVAEESANGHAAIGGSNGHPHQAGSNGHPANPDAAAE